MSLCFLDCILDNHGWRLYDTVPFTVTGCSWKFKYRCVHVKPTVNHFSDVMAFCAISELVFVKSKFCVGSNKPWSSLSLSPCLHVIVMRRLTATEYFIPHTHVCAYGCGPHSLCLDLTEIVECCWTRLRSSSRLCFRSWTGAVTPSPSLPPFPRPVQGKAWSSGRFVWQTSNGVSHTGASVRTRIKRCDVWRAMWKACV